MTCRRSVRGVRGVSLCKIGIRTSVRLTFQGLSYGRSPCYRYTASESKLSQREEGWYTCAFIPVIAG